MLKRRPLYLLITLGIAVLCLLGFLSLPAMAQSPVPETSGPAGPAPEAGVTAPNPPGPTNVLLYSQYNNPYSVAYSSQNFEAVNDAYDDFLADDFVVPAGQKWGLNLVNVQGEYFNGVGPADSMNVFIYTEAITMPGTLLQSRAEMAYTNTDTNFAISISPAILLEPGKYWISVQANQNIATEGQWGWTARTSTANRPAAWENPNDGFLTGCTSWGLRTSCLPGGLDAPDQVFSLVGSKIFPQCGIPSHWSIRTMLPEAVYGSAVVNDGNNAFVIGGFQIPGAGDITQTLRYNPVDNTLSPIAPIIQQVSESLSVYSPFDNKLYVFGGEKISTNEIYSSTLIYNIATNSWVRGVNMPDERAFMAGGYYNGKVYLVGGYSTPNVDPSFAQVWEYDVALTTWAAKASMPEPLGGAASVVVNGHLYVIGGRDLANQARSQTYDYDIALDTWTVRSDAPYGVNVAGAAVVGGKIWVVGGGNPFVGLEGYSTLAQFNSPNTTGTTLIYDPANDTWAEGPTLNVPRSFIGITALKGRLIAIGGWEGLNSSAVTEVMGVCLSYLPKVRR